MLPVSGRRVLDHVLVVRQTLRRRPQTRPPVHGPRGPSQILENGSSGGG